MALQGELHLELDEPREAASAWQEALELNQWNQSLRWKLAELLRTKLDSPREATRQYRRCAEMGGPRAEKAAEWVDKLKTTHKGKDSPEPSGGEQAP